MRKGVTLVTVVYAPIAAYPHPHLDRGFEVACEFIQKTRFSMVDADGFTVHSEMGEYPIQVPSDETMMTLMRTPDELQGLGRGFLDGRRTPSERERFERRTGQRAAVSEPPEGMPDLPAISSAPPKALGSSDPPPPLSASKDPDKPKPPLKRFSKLEFD
jgi:hypothetical protein